MARHFGPNFTIERADLQQLLVLIDLVLDIEPVLADDFIISLEDVDEGCRGSRCTTDDSIREVDFIGGGSVVRSAIERAEERGTFEMAERCMRVLGGVEDMTHMRRKTIGVHGVTYPAKDMTVNVIFILSLVRTEPRPGL